MATREMSRRALARLLQCEDIEQASFGRLVQLVREEEGISDFKPDGVCQVDPRTGDRIIYNSARAQRPHDNRPPAEGGGPREESRPECPVCQGQTTGVIDAADLSQGFTFINKNLFPALYPHQGEAYQADLDDRTWEPAGMPAYGLHLLQWSSSRHDKDWHNMPHADRVVVMERLAALEKKLATGATEALPASQLWSDGAGRCGFVEIIKNYGRLVGGSLTHGHQQIGFSNVRPRHVGNNRRFEQARGEPFSAYLLRENPGDLTLRDYGPAILVTPYFMRRPFDMMLLLKETGKSYLHDLDRAEIGAVADGWHDAIRVMLWGMGQMGREAAYNVITHNGPGAGLYFEFLPYTQEMGGFEHMGLFVCQANPQDTARQIRGFLNA